MAFGKMGKKAHIIIFIFLCISCAYMLKQMGAGRHKRDSSNYLIYLASDIHINKLPPLLHILHFSRLRSISDY